MKSIIYFSVSFIFVWSSFVDAESNLVDIPQDELLNVYLEDQANSNISSDNSTNAQSNQVKQVEETSRKIETADNSQSEELDVIDLENADEEAVEVQVYESSSDNSTSAQLFCKQNPNAQECLYSQYLHRCKKDPQSYACRDQLAKFNNFCATFPRAYKCKKANLAAMCTREPNSSECKAYKKRYCQKYPKTEFCVWN